MASLSACEQGGVGAERCVLAVREVFFSGGADLAWWRRPEECVLVHSCPVLSWLCAALSLRVI